MGREADLNIKNSIDFLGFIATQFPIVAFTGVTYDPKPHGIPSKNNLIEETSAIDLAELFLEGNYPYFGSIWLNRENMFDKETLAIGGIVYVWPGEIETTINEKRIYLQGLTFEGESIKRLSKMLPIFPMAILGIDFDCPNSEPHKEQIKNILNQLNINIYEPYLFDSGGSFHLAFKTLINPKNIPYHYGSLIEIFSTLPQYGDLYIFKEIADKLKGNWDNPDEIRKVCDLIFNKICHYDSPEEGKVPFILDLRWMAHSLLELLDFLETKDGSAAFLRISDKSGEGIVPFRVNL